MDESSPIKDILYEQINSISEHKIQEEISKNNTSSMINQIIDASYQKISQLIGNTHENFETFAESLMHYFLTNTLVPSQRKITVKTTNIDIVIPDSRTLVSSPKDALVILFPKTDHIGTILESIKKLQDIQPLKENIWIVQKTNLGLDYKTFEIDNTRSFANLIQNIEMFLSQKTQSKFKIFKI